jgi:hypothetical protein
VEEWPCGEEVAVAGGAVGSAGDSPSGNRAAGRAAGGSVGAAEQAAESATASPSTQLSGSASPARLRVAFIASASTAAFVFTGGGYYLAAGRKFPGLHDWRGPAACAAAEDAQ